jgi:hypothetical protein
MSQPKQVVLVEWDLVPEEVLQRIRGCLEVRKARWVRSYVTTDGRRSICEFEAPDAETVREAFRAAGHPCERVWVADLYWREE